MSSYALRLPEALKLASRRLAAADDNDESVFVVAIAEETSAMETAAFFERRSATASRAKADRAWAKVGKNKPSHEDY